MVPSLIELQKQYGGQGLVILAIDAGNEDVPSVRVFAEANKVNYINLMGDPPTIEAYRLTAHPLTVLISPQGTIYSSYVGATSKETLEQDIQVLLAQRR